MGIEEQSSLGGVARAKALSPERRKEIGRAAIAARWGGHKKVVSDGEVFALLRGMVARHGGSVWWEKQIGLLEGWLKGQ
jgi:hypothetical protein